MDTKTDVYELELTTYYTPEKQAELKKKPLSDLYAALRDQYGRLGLDTFPRERDYLHIRATEHSGFMIAWYANRTTDAYKQIQRLYSRLRNDSSLNSLKKELQIERVELRETPYIPDPEYLEYRARGEHKMQHSTPSSHHTPSHNPPGTFPPKNPNKYMYSGTSYSSFKKNVGKKSNEETRELARRIEKTHAELDAALARRAQIEKELAALAPSGGPELDECNLSLRIASLEETLATERAARERMQACLADIEAEIKSPLVVPNLLKAVGPLREKR